MTENHDFLAHHGVIGQKWGHRRYQNPDGSLTPEGRRHWGLSDTSKMSDQDMQKAITRANLERRYANAMETSKTKSNAKQLAKTAFGAIASTLDATGKISGFSGAQATKAMNAMGHPALASEVDKYLGLERSAAKSKNLQQLSTIGANSAKMAKGGVEISEKKFKQYKHKLANFSDEELKKMVERAELERKYEDEVKNRNFNDTMQSVNAILGTVGAVAGIATAGLTIYKTISDMKGN